MLVLTTYVRTYSLYEVLVMVIGPGSVALIGVSVIAWQLFHISAINPALPSLTLTFPSECKASEY